jgi:hypothetical protein
MKRTQQTFFALCLTLACGPLAGVSNAQGTANAAPGVHGWAKAPASSEDRNISGSIQQVIPQQNKKGSVHAMQIVVAGPQGAVTANLGSLLAEDVKKSLAAGESVHLTGYTSTVNGQSIFAVRTLTIENGKTVVVRNEHGFLVRNNPAGKKATTNTTVNGDAR